MSTMGDAWTKPAHDKTSINLQNVQIPGIWKMEEDKGRLCEVC